MILVRRRFILYPESVLFQEFKVKLVAENLHIGRFERKLIDTDRVCIINRS